MKFVLASLFAFGLLASCVPALENENSAGKLTENYSKNGTAVTKETLIVQPWCEITKSSGEASETLLFKQNNSLVRNFWINDKVNVSRFRYSVVSGQITVISGSDTQSQSWSAWTSDKVWDDGSLTLLVTDGKKAIEYTSCPNAPVQE